MESLEKFIEFQADAVDDILLNAYGTVYKFAIKQAISPDANYVLSPTEDRLSAKNLFANLWSVLDFCCTILYSCCTKRLPTLSQGMEIKFPCSLKRGMSLEEWEKRTITKMLQDEADAEMLTRLKGIFTHVQFKNGGEDFDEDKEVYYFYLLHYLRNTLTHNSIDLKFRRNTRDAVPDIWNGLGKTLSVSSEILVPPKPWLIASRNDRSTHVHKPFLDVLYHTCRVVEKCRDQILTKFPRHKTFCQKYMFELTKEHLIITLGNGDPKKFLHQALHLECYGVEAELKKDLDEFRKPE